MQLRHRKGLSPRALRIECLEQRRLFVASLDIQASIKTVDADNAPGIVLTSGENAATTYRVTNNGDMALTDLSVVDDNGTPSPDDDIVALPNLTTLHAQGTLRGTHSFGFAYGFLMHPTQPFMYAGIDSPDSGENRLLIFNTNTLALSTVDIEFLEAKYLALSNNGNHLYLGGTGGGFSVPVLDLTTRTLLPAVPGWAYDGLNVGADGRLLIHAIGDIDQVSPHNGQQVGPSITLPGNDFYYGTSLISPDKTRLYYLSESPVRSTFNQIDMTTDPPTRLWRMETDSIGEDIALTNDGAYVSIITDVGLEGVSGVPKYRTSDMSLVGSFNTGGLPKEITYSPDGQIAYIVSTTGKIGIWDANTFQKLADINVTGGEPVELQVDASGKHLFVAVDGATDSVQIYSTGRGSVTNTGDTNLNNRFDPGEAWTFRATITAQPGQHVHVAKATAYANGTVAITDTDPSNYIVYTTWEGEATVEENVSGTVIGPLPTYPWNGPWNVSDGRFEVVQGKLQLKWGEYLTASEDDGIVVEVWTTQTTPFEVARFTLNVTENSRPWHRPGEPRDVDGNGHIVALDALLVINRLHFMRNAPSSELGARPSNLHHLDVNDDGHLTAADALAIINWLHANPVGAGAEGEGETAAATERHSSSLLLLDPEDPVTAVASARVEVAPMSLNTHPALIATDWVFNLTEPEQSTTRSRRTVGGVSSDTAPWWPENDADASIGLP